jgi:chromate transporter
VRGPGGRDLTDQPAEPDPTEQLPATGLSDLSPGAGRSGQSPDAGLIGQASKGPPTGDARGRVSPARLLSAIGLLGLTSLGGWPSYYHDDFVVKRRWLSDEEYLEGNALSNAVPGPVFTNLTIYAAYRLGGWASVVLGLALVLLPGALAMVALTLWYDWHGPGVGHDPLVSAGLKGLGAGAAAFTAITPFRLLRSSAVGPRGLVVAAIGCVALALLGYSLLVVVPPLALLAIWLERPRVSASA